MNFAPLNPADRAGCSMMAATAAEHGMAVATRHVADFSGTGAQIINPFAP